MQTTKSETVQVRSSAEVVNVRHVVRRWAIELGFSLIEQTKIVTAASELARNMVDYGKGGALLLEALDDGIRKGLRLTFEDQGPGIADIDQALRDGFTSGNGMGLGLGGARRLSNEFSIHSRPGEGTRVMIARWRGSA
ncbi:MAG: putative anti-sigma regulatory factor, serine/threonine protein kinase [Acidobacteria bacterium]|nr:putative anti-sigma regulatory factor, serine/threonine protein kinase [Acidobacteriota bacterium]